MDLYFVSYTKRFTTTIIKKTKEIKEWKLFCFDVFLSCISFSLLKRFVILSYLMWEVLKWGIEVPWLCYLLQLVLVVFFTLMVNLKIDLFSKRVQVLKDQVSEKVLSSNLVDTIVHIKRPVILNYWQGSSSTL